MLLRPQMRTRLTSLTAIVVVLAVFRGPALVRAQQFLSSGSSTATVGSLQIPSKLVPSTCNRVAHNEMASPDGVFIDNAVGLTYNRLWGNFGMLRDDLTQPSASLMLESYWNGSVELNLDIAPAHSAQYIRPLTYSAGYDGSRATLIVGPGAGANSARVFLRGGTGKLASLVTILDQTGRDSPADMLEMARQDGSDSFAWRAGGVPRLNFALAQELNADRFGNYGVFNFGGEWDYGEPIMALRRVGIAARLLESIPASTDTRPRFVLFADGRANWGPGTGPLDADLYRSGAFTLTTDGSLVIGGDLRVMGSKAAMVSTESYGMRELYAVESPGEWFEDFGSARLRHGRRTVKIDPVFGQTISITHDYHIFLTPTGPCNLYVERKDPDGFVVRALSGLGSCAFDYRIVAKRKKYERVRMAEVRGVK